MIAFCACASSSSMFYVIIRCDIVMFLGLYDWDLSLKAKTDGSFGLEGLKYASLQECDGGAGQLGCTVCQNALDEINQEAGGGVTQTLKEDFVAEGYVWGS